jgi:SAM-dependent methyltransferase
MTVWMPRFVCPGCATALEPRGPLELGCPDCHRVYESRGGAWRFLDPARQSALEAFARQYRAVRQNEGRRAVSGEYYRRLPSVPADDPHARDWRIRQETFRHLLGHVLAAGRQPSAVLDLGAGNGWLSHRLAALGHHVVAVDAMDDEADGLGAVRHYAAPLVAVHADFDALPFAAGQFDIAIFNGSLHYAPDPASTLASVRRLLLPDGMLVVMDSPMFRADRDGAAMLTDSVRRFARDHGLQAVVQPGCGYLTFARLAASAGALSMEAEFVPSRGSLGWRLRRRLAHLRLGRQPAAFGLWVAR